MAGTCFSPQRLGYAERFFQRRGALVVVVARFFEILRQLNGILSGIAGMRWWRFLLSNAAGATLWVAFWSILFFQLGKRGDQIAILLRGYEPLAAVVIVLVVASVITQRIIRHRGRREKENRS